MPMSKYERLLNKIKKQRSYINVATNQSEWSDEPSTNINMEDVSVLSIEDNEKILEEAKKVRLQVREIVKQKMNLPKLYLSISGEQSTLNKPEDVRMPLKFLDIQSLILSSLCRQQAPYRTEWCTLLRKAYIPRVLLIVIDGIGITEMYSLGENNTKKRKRNNLEAEDDSGLELEEPCKKIKCSTGDSSSGHTSVEMHEKWDPPYWLKQTLPKSAELFGIHMEVASSGHPISELFTTPISKCYIARINTENNTSFSETFAELQNQPQQDLRDIAKTFFTDDQYDRRELLLNKDDMFKFSYPMNFKGAKGYCDEEFVHSKDEYEKVTKSSPIFGVDCEMCMTTRGSELTMVSIVNENCEVIYSTYVLPKFKIINYLTMYSGITKETLKSVSVTLKDVQKFIRENLPADAILVGHSLNCDLLALKIFHPYVIDTAIIYNLSGMKGVCPSLRLCSKLFLNRIIQKSGKVGHDPTEDASASLQLAKLKLSRDISFGDISKTRKLPFDEKLIGKTTAEMKKFQAEALNMNYWWAKNFHRNLFSLTTKENLATCLMTIGNCGPTFESLLETSPSTKVCGTSKDIKELFKIASSEILQTHFNVLHIKMGDMVEGEDAESKEECLKKQLKVLDKRVRKLHQELPDGSLTVLSFMGSCSIINGQYGSSGMALIDIKGQEKKNYYSFRKL